MEKPTFKLYQKKMPVLWWAKRLSHLHFILRELTSLSVGFFAVVGIFYLRALSKGAEAYESFLSILQSPVMIVAHLIAFSGLLFHSVTWLNLAPKAMKLKINDYKISGGWIVAGNYVAWLLLSLWMILIFIQ
ncbi:hypothetical protein AAG747_04130 [Rapidithrix thailandica]|uniref:Fumarate reductase subunit C n=1 Tax=Rapidithrix thailandica TaxID=413964 RepID=A0AAW9S3T3_9BACT